MANKMLIDASHPEETRVVVLRGNRVEEFDFEAASKRQLRGNIYLAKVTRVEPSLQAAFVEYGGNRHGFLAFSEIHPDYYQIPVADRQALLEDEARAQAQEEEDEARPAQQSQQRRSRRNRRDRTPRPEKRSFNNDETLTGSAEGGEVSEGEPLHNGEQPYDTSATHAAAAHEPQLASPPEHGGSEAHSHFEAAAPQEATTAEWPPHEPAAPAHVQSDDISEAHVSEAHVSEAHNVAEHAGHSVAEAPRHPDVEIPGDADDSDDEDGDPEDEAVEQLGGDAMEEIPVRAPRMRRQYKIQEVIKRRQVLLIQVVKEERGNKGAALTTYLSLAGRYSVLMPNTARGGGISRKITDAQDRRRLKEIVQELEVPDGMGIILRTAGAARTTGEVKRDFEYLLRMWETVREVTLKSSAPTLVYEEGSLIKRSIRDLYNKDVEEIVVAGEAGFREAQNFMRLLMPGNVKSVKMWDEPQPIFAKSGVEAQLDAMYSNQVTLKSGGYIVIGQTEALVAIDVNSGRSTREHNIEDTAVRTNLEAADEVARQLRLRDLAGLVVVDFIDMEENRNNRAVERRMKDALKNDRARIQVGHISHFGLLEMSRQRIRTGILEGSTVVCTHCSGSGMMRSTSSIALHVLRVLEDALIRSATHNIAVRTRTEVALYILNQKRAHLHDIEKRFGVMVIVAADDTLTGAVYHSIERGELASPPVEYKLPHLVSIDSITPDQEMDGEPEDETEFGTEGETEAADEPGADGSSEGSSEESEETSRPRKRRRRRGRNDREGGPFQAQDAPQPPDAALAMLAQANGILPANLAEATLSDGESDEAEAATEFEASDVPRDNGGDFDPRRKRRSRRGGRNRSDRDRPDRVRMPPEPVNNGTMAPDFVAPDFVAPDFVPPDFVPPDFVAPEDATTARVIVDVLPEHHIAHDFSQPVMRADPDVVAGATMPQPVAFHAPASEPEAVRAPAAPRAYAEPLPEAPNDPEKRKSGWWQRAKQSFGGS